MCAVELARKKSRRPGKVRRDLSLVRLAANASSEHVICLGRESQEKIILRKEVIQPQVPLRLPCYDLVPIKSFAFGTLTRLRALLSFVA